MDGGRDILIEGNEVMGCDLGIEVGAENHGYDATGIAVRSNLLHHNEKGGLVFGGYDPSVGRVRNCEFRNNTCYRNDTLGTGVGELWIQWASDNVVADNIFVTTAQATAMYSESGSVNNTLDHNLWFSPAGAGGTEWVWLGVSFPGWAAFRAGTGQEAHGQFADPRFVDEAGLDLRLRPDSPAVDAGDPAAVPLALDREGLPRLLDGNLDGVPRIDQGAYEFGHVRLAVTGTPAPGATLTLQLDGTAGLAGLVAGGFPGAALHPRYGGVFLDLARPHGVQSAGPLPATTTGTIPPGLPSGTVLTLQPLARSGAAGCPGNPVTLVLQ